MSTDCYFCSRIFDSDRPQVRGVTTPICRPCWTHVRDDDSAVLEFDDSQQTPTDPYIIPVFGRFSVEDA